MQIHELNNYNGALNSGAYIAVDNGSDTGKVSAAGLLAGVSEQIETLDNDLNARIDNIIAGGDAPSAAEIVDARLGANGTTYPSLGDAIRGQVSDLTDEIDTLSDELVEIIQSKNRYDGSYASGFVSQVDGLWYNSATYAGSQEYIELLSIPSVWSLRPYGGIALAFRYAVYDEDKNFITGATVDVSDMSQMTNPDDPSTNVIYLKIDTPNAKYMRFSILAGLYTNPTIKMQVEAGETPTKYSEYFTTYAALNGDALANANITKQFNNAVNGNREYFKKSASLASGVNLNIDTNFSIRKNKVYHLFANIDSSFDSLYFGHGEGNYSYYFKLDNNNIAIMSNGAVGTTLAHGLTLDTYVDILFTVGESGTGNIIINTLGGIYKRNLSVQQGYMGNVFVRPDNCTITNVYIGFSSMDFRQPIWMFGDSYFTHTADNRWTYYLIDWEFGRCLLNAYPGEASASALTQLESYLSNVGLPKYIVWCLGMNDPDTQSAVNSSWQTAVNKVLDYCDRYNIEPILSTIPNIPAYSNYYKNEFVRNSGYRYIDFAKAVGAETIGSTWYDGCLSSDNTHPTALGARLLCLRALIDVPELTLGNI